MRLILVTGGARSGKSDYAERRAAELGGDAVTYIATAIACDDEMAARIARHRAARPAAWRTVEAPRDAAAAVRAAATDVVLLDCLTLLASNALLSSVHHGGGADAGGNARDGGPARAGHRAGAGGEAGAGRTAIEDAAHAAVAAEVDALLGVAATRAGTLLVVTNEVGFGIVPPTVLGRWFRDALGTANRRLAAAADEVVLLVSGVPLHIKGGARFAGSPAPPAM